MQPCAEVFKTKVRTSFQCLFPMLILNVQKDQSHVNVCLEPNVISYFAPGNKTCLKSYNDRINSLVHKDFILRVDRNWGAELGNDYLLTKVGDSKLRSDMNGQNTKFVKKT